MGWHILVLVQDAGLLVVPPPDIVELDPPFLHYLPVPDHLVLILDPVVEQEGHDQRRHTPGHPEMSAAPHGEFGDQVHENQPDEQSEHPCGSFPLHFVLDVQIHNL